MGHSTRYLGRLDIRPVLREPEVEWLRAYAELHDPRRRGYDVPMNPRADRRSGRVDEAEPDDDHATTGALAPWGSCDWMPCVEGCCLNWRDVEKSNNAVLWLRHLIDHFLRPGGLAQGARSDFESFTFDHVVEGVIAAERTDTRELYLIRAVDNAVSTQTLVPGDLSGW